MVKHYQINLLRSVDFYSLASNYSTIFNNFHLLYYITDIWNLKIVSQYAPNSFIFNIYSSKNQLTTKICFFIEELNRTNFSPSGKNNTIVYRIKKMREQNVNEDQKRRGLYLDVQETVCTGIKGEGDGFLITVSMEVGQEKCEKECDNQQIQEEQIIIKIVDHNDFFEDTFKSMHSDMQRGERNYRLKQVNQKQIQYFFKQPYQLRYPSINKQHFSIAFQGGGVKGLSYIGVYQALKQIYKDKTYDMIQNVIGSSAGAIFGLVVICNLSKEEANQVGLEFGSITKTDRIKLQDIEELSMSNYSNLGSNELSEEDFEEILKEILVDNGIIDQEVFDFFKQVLDDQKVIESILYLLKIWNQEVCGLMTMNSAQGKKLTLLRILRNTMMSGNTIQKIACKCLSKLFSDLPSEKMSQITFAELYEKTKKQFTCTGVDLTDQMIRFFNPKTTPHMPVAKAVLISASFPIAFVGQKWKKQWGKYYVHYDSTRREIDLAGHLFTDGGLLSNFPIKYLDNESVRPIYFKHMKVNGKTKIFGFGLMHIENQNDYINKKKLQLQKASQNILAAIKNTINFGKIVKYLLCGSLSGLFKSCLGLDTVQSEVKPERNPTISTAQYMKQLNSIEHVTSAGFAGKLRQIPVIDFLFSLIDTLLRSDTNFIKECFAPECFNVTFPPFFEEEDIEKKNPLKPQQWLQRYDHQKYLDKIQQMINQIQCNNSEEIDETEKGLQENFRLPYNNLLKNLSSLKMSLKKKIHRLKESQIVDFSIRINSIISGIYYEGHSHQELKQKSIISQLRKWIVQLNQMCSGKFFHRQDIKHDGHRLLRIIESLTKAIVDQQKLLQISLVRLYNAELNSSKKLSEDLLEYEQRIRKKQKYVPLPAESILDWTRRQNFETLCLHEDYKQKILRVVNCLNVPQLSISRYGVRVRNRIRGYVHKMLHKSIFKKVQSEEEGRNVHIVLESQHVSQFYFSQFIDYFEQAIFDFNRIQNYTTENSFKIRSMTSSGYQSLAAVLYASSISKDTMNYYTWKIRNSIHEIPAEQLVRQFNKLKWAYTNKQMILQIEEQIWKQRFDLLKQIQKKYENRDQKEITKIDDLWLVQQNNSKDQINDAFHKTINYAMKIMEQSEKIPAEKRTEWIRQNFSVEKGGKENYKKKTESENEESVRFFEKFITKFGDMVKYSLIISCNIAFPMMEHIHDPEARKQAWKGVILGKVLSSLKLKSLIKLILKDIGLDPNATLRDFFNSSKKKMLINFLVIESATKKMVVLNHHTRPNMPLWAAVIATSSLPYIFEPQMDFKEWSQRNQDEDERSIQDYFKQIKKNEENYLQSGSFLCKLPLELITNQKVRKSIGSFKNEVYLSLTFDDFPRKIKDHILFQTTKTLKMKPINMFEMIKMIKNNSFELIKNQFSQKGPKTHFASLQLVLDAQDNTFLSLYKAQSIQLPTRLSTIDFDRINCAQSLNNNQSIFSSVVKECIENAKLVSYQKIYNNIEKKSRPRKIFMKVKSKGSIELQTRKQNQFTPHQLQVTNTNLRMIHSNTQKRNFRKIIVQFPSAIIEDFYHVTQRYRIFYRINFDALEKKRKMNMFDRKDEDKTYKEIEKFSFEVDCSGEKNLVIDFKIVYVDQLNHQSKVKLAEVYHRIDFVDFLEKPILENFAYTYCIQYDSYYGKISPPLEPNNLINQGGVSFPKIKIESFNSAFWQSKNICNNCGYSEKPMRFIKTKKSFKSKCFNNCSQRKFVIYECENQKCLAKYCLYCKYELQFNSDSIKCFLEHQLEQKYAVEMESEEADRESQSGEAMKIRICDFCRVYSPVLYHDNECGITICDICKKNKQYHSY